MAPKYVGFLIFVYVIAMIAGSVSTGSDMFANANVTDPVQGVQSFAVSLYNADFTTIPTPMVIWTFWQDLFRILLLDFPVFHEGPWVVLRWVILAPIIGTVIYGIVSAFFGLFQRNV